MRGKIDTDIEFTDFDQITDKIFLIAEHKSYFNNGKLLSIKNYN
jgi:hypothetical protein